MFEQTVDIERIEQIINLFGNFDENIKRIEKKYKVSITSHGSQIRVRGDVTDVMNAVRTIEGLLVMINKGDVYKRQRLRLINLRLKFRRYSDLLRKRGIFPSAICSTPLIWVSV